MSRRRIATFALSAAAAGIVGIAAEAIVNFVPGSGWLSWRVRHAIIDAGAPRLSVYAAVVSLQLFSYAMAVMLGFAATIATPTHARWTAMWCAVGMLAYTAAWSVYLEAYAMLSWQSPVILLALLPTLLFNRRSNPSFHRMALRAAADPER